MKLFCRKVNIIINGRYRVILYYRMKETRCANQYSGDGTISDVPLLSRIRRSKVSNMIVEFVKFLMFLLGTFAFELRDKIVTDVDDRMVELKQQIATTGLKYQNAFVIVEDGTLSETGSDISNSLNNEFPTVWVHLDSVDRFYYINETTRMESNLFIYLGTCCDLEKSKVFFDSLDLLVMDEMKPHVLMISLEKSCESRNLFDLMSYTWRIWYTDATVVQISDSTKGKRNVIVNRFDSFRLIPYRETLSREKSLFEFDYPNLRGRTVSLRTFACPTFQFWLNAYCTQEYFYAKSPDYEAIKALSERMGFEYRLSMGGKRINKIFGFPPESPSHPIQMIVTRTMVTATSRSYAFTTPSMMTRVCAIVPIFTEKQHVMTLMEIFMTLVVTLIVIGIFYLCAILLLVDKQVWNVWNMMSVFFGRSMTGEPRGMKDKIIFIFMVMAFNRFTNYLYSDLVKTSLSIDREIEFNSFEDILKSNLIPMVNVELRQSLIENKGDKAFSETVEKSIGTPHMIECFRMLVYYKNVTCIVNDLKEESFRVMMGSNTKNLFRMSRACVGTYPVAYRVRTYSPYVEQFSVGMLEFQASGLFKKWMNEFTRPMSENMTKTMEVDEPVEQLSFIRYCFVGYFVASVVFVIELVASRFCFPSINQT